MSAKHTPGPWELWSFHHHGDTAFSIRDAYRELPGAEDGLATGRDCEARDNANSNLIAAAPDLAEAAERARAFLEMFDAPSFLAQYHPDLWDAADGVIVALREALAKARGEE